MADSTTDVKLHLSKAQLYSFFKDTLEIMESRPIPYGELYTLQLTTTKASVVLRVWEHSGEEPTGKTLLKQWQFYEEEA
jgi:hypothetical protein